MNDEAQQQLDKFVSAYVDSAPEGWLRIVTWWAKLGATPQEASVSSVQSPTTVVVRGPDGVLSTQFLQPARTPYQYVRGLDRAVEGEPEEGWLVLKVQIDNDGSDPQIVFDHETLVPMEGSSTSGWADDVHRHLQRHREELEALSARVSQAAQPKRRWSLFRP